MKAGGGSSSADEEIADQVTSPNEVTTEPADEGSLETQDSNQDQTQVIAPPVLSEEASSDNINPQDEEPNKSSGSKNHSKLLKKVFIGVVAAAIVIAAVSVCVYLFYHDWSPATCTSPQVCSICGATQGEALGHDWEKATCESPRTCARCGEEDGDALGHDWGEWATDKESTCTVAGSKHRTCDRCGETEQQSLPLAEHQPGDWEVVTEATVDASGNAVPGERVRKCKVCGKELESEEMVLSAEEIAAQYKSSCTALTYEQVARDPDAYEGTKAVFTGEVIQVMQDGTYYTLRVNVTPASWGGYTDTIMVGYDASAGDSRILEDDVITFYGTMAGLYSYESVMGAEITVPLMFAEYIDR